MADLDPKDLESRIALLQGQIQRHKEYLSTTTGSSRVKPHHNTYRSSPTYHPYNQRHNPATTPTFRNKTLIINNSSLPTITTKSTTDESTIEASPSWIATSSRNAQIINSAAYNPTAGRDRITSPAAKLREKAQAIHQELRSSQERTVTADGIQYSVQAGGSKLVRIGANTSPTPKRLVISGIPFVRSKNGNLYRESIIKRNGNIPATKKPELCKRFTNTGSCTHGPNCAFTHDPAKVAVCREFLRSGSCSQGQHCDLSHDLTYERVPACVHFVRGGCTKENCPYPHVRVSPAASVCRAFTSLGYCSKGIDCQERHVFECPDYAEGKCHNPKCRLPHVDRAGQLRQHNTTAPDSIKSDTGDFAITDSASDIDSEDEVTVVSTFSQEQDFLHL